jgi:hypothetical protein
MKIQFDTSDINDVQTVLELCTILKETEEKEDAIRQEEEQAQTEAIRQEEERTEAQRQVEDEKEEAAGFSFEEIRAKARKLAVNKKGKDALVALLKEFGAKTLNGLKEEDHTAFMGKLIGLVGWSDE